MAPESMRDHFVIAGYARQVAQKAEGFADLEALRVLMEHLIDAFASAAERELKQRAALAPKEQTASSKPRRIRRERQGKRTEARREVQQKPAKAARKRKHKERSEPIQAQGG